MGLISILQGVPSKGDIELVEWGFNYLELDIDNDLVQLIASSIAVLRKHPAADADFDIETWVLSVIELLVQQRTLTNCLTVIEAAQEQYLGFPPGELLKLKD